LEEAESKNDLHKACKSRFKGSTPWLDELELQQIKIKAEYQKKTCTSCCE